MKKLFSKNLFYVLLCVALVHIVVGMFSGQWFFGNNPYNSYELQANSWKLGYLDLGQDYPHLEIAYFNNKFYLSFPPFPSMLYFPFALFLGFVPEGTIALFMTLLATVYSYLILSESGKNENICAILTIMLVCASNYLFVSVNAWVWFIAQNMSFALCLGSIYHALKKQGVMSLLFLACAIGCRPFQIIYFPIIAYILIKRSGGIATVIKNKMYWFISPLIIGCFYMWLNYARFGNIFEFGHNYLPEFVESPDGQFNLSYILYNLRSLILLPKLTEANILDFPKFNGFNIFLINPILLVFLLCFVKDIGKQTGLKILCVLLVCVHIILICCHKTMGGWQFGNRYIIDCFPIIAYFISLVDFDSKYEKIFLLLAIYGIAFNSVGTILMYLQK